LVVEKLHIELPIPPSVNHMYRNFTKNGRRMRVHTAEAKRFFTDAGWKLKPTVTAARWVALDEKTVVDLWVWWPDRRIRDVDNLNKGILDALKLYKVVTDDHFCLPRWQDYYYDPRNPRVEADVWKMESGHLITAQPQTNGIGESCGDCPLSSVIEALAIPTTGL